MNDTSAWRASALCAQTDPDLWFPPVGGRPDAALEICDRCTVRAECDAFAEINAEPYGVWGGRNRSPRARRRRPPRVRVLWDPDTGEAWVA